MLPIRKEAELFALLILAAFCCMPALAAGTTEVHVVKYANDNATIINDTTVSFQWMEEHLPVYGDGVTHYYLQGPVFNASITDKWNPEENDPAILTKDFGAVKGTDLKDLCDLVGGMQVDDFNVTLVASDGFSKAFAYSSIYNPPARAGPIVLTWYRADQGYVNGSYDTGMRNVMFADTSSNPWTYHVFGLWDMHESYPEAFWYFYQPGQPSATGLSVQNINQVLIYTNDPVPPTGPVADFSANVTNGLAPLTVQFTNTSTGGPISFAWDFNNDGIIDSTVQDPVWTYTSAGTYTVNLTVSNAIGSDSEIKSGYISVTEYTTPLDAEMIFDTIPSTMVEGHSYDVSVTVRNTGTTTWSDADEFRLGGVDDFAGDAAKFAYPRANISSGATVVSGTSYTFNFTMTAPSNGTYNPAYRMVWDYHQWFGPTLSNPVTVTVAPTVNELFNGTLTLTPGTNFTKVAYNSGTNYTINRTTPLGALDAAAAITGFTYDVTDKRWASDQVLLLDNISNYTKATGKWYVYVNGVYKDGYLNNPNGLNVLELVNNDQVNFFFAANSSDITAPANAIAAVKIKVNVGNGAPADWSILVKGARTQAVTQTYFEQGLACPSSGHMVNWTDSNGAVWSGVPLWLLVAMVDDNPDTGPDHFNFNDTLASQGYSVKITAGDGFNTTLASGDIARNNGYIVANKLNGTDLPLMTPGEKLSWPLHLKGSAVFGGQQIGNITMIELTGMPQPSQGWTLTLEGDVVDVISQQYFEQAIVCHHNVTYTDGSGSVWTGVPLWDLVGAVDDIESTSHWTFNDTRANITGYTVRVIAGDGYNKTFTSLNVSHNNGFIVTNTLNGSPLSGSNGHLRLVGPATTSNGQRVSNITTIRLEGLPSYPSGDYSLALKGKICDVIPQPELEAWIAANTATYTDGSGNAYSGIPLWRLLAWVDDRTPAGPDAFNSDAASAGYKIIVKAGDGYSKEFQSGAVAQNDNYIVANTLNGSALPTSGSHPPWPLRLVGSALPDGSSSVGNIVEIALTDFTIVQTAAPVHIIKYGSDGVTIINETNVTYQWMEQNLAVIGDGITAYNFEGLTLNASNLWDPEETYPGGFKISNVVKGTRVHDLAELVGGMGSGTTITFVASDGFETTLPYSSIYTNPAVQARQGDAVLAWWGDGQYVPGYADGMRLFFMPSDHVYGQWDMHETLPSTYWRYNYQDGVQYPSCAGLSAKYITTIKVYSSPESDWALELDGRDIGGINYTVSKPYFEEALACQFGANHSSTFTDSSGRVWEGMPLWFLCGFVDDADLHSPNSYNESKAMAGYNITITGTDGYNYTFDSRDTIRNANYIVANSLNGTHIPEIDSSWPLRLVGQNVSGGKVVKKIASIRLVPLESPPLAENTLYISPTTRPVVNGTTATYEVRVSSLPVGLAGYDLQVTLDNPAIAEITGVQYPGWGGMNNTTPHVPADSLRLSAVDVGRNVEPGSVNTLLATITIRADTPGTSVIRLSNVNMDADGGALITPVPISSGEIIVHVPLVADFEANETSGKASAARPLVVAFSDRSTGLPPGAFWSWDFDNNGSIDSTLQNPVISFARPGNYTVKLTVENAYSSDTEIKVNYIRVTSFVKPFPGQTNEPTDPNGDYLYEDINGNGRLDYDDVVIYYENMQWIRDQLDVGIEPYDYNGNGRIDYDDVVVLYWKVLESP